ncbi:rod shape-determining protein MreD [Cytobacillus praedii]|uniref:Rod shape-determining protein MreD n=1 Tax=Cytobacillus praedii TaxID=1742358 RepID=A0A4R1AQX5_9BACI|nr:rod shape-determining protein MreD [Cytobacillus praedii]TCJ02426.1 rod shape-determining protein MreD [Cytobacillus praedii]
MRKFLLPLLLMLFFIIESIFVELMPPKVFGNEYILVPHFLMIAIILLTVYGPKNYGVLYGFLFGLLFDIVYTEIMGIYLCLFPLVAYICYKLMKILQTNIVMVTFISIVGVALLELGAYEMNVIINRTNMTFASYSMDRLIPTLTLNFIFIILTVYPFKRHFEKLALSLDA